MKCVILCAGKSTRTYPLTLERPKPFISLAGKTLLEHNLDNMKGIVNEAILVVGPGKETIRNSLGNSYGNIKITYAEQGVAKGTAHALLQAEKFLKNEEKFLVFFGDNFYPREAIEECASYGISVLGQKVPNPEEYGIFLTEGGFLKDIEEKPKDPKSDLANAGLFVLNDRIFEISRKLKPSLRAEYEITDALKEMIKKIRFRCFYTRDWVPVVYPWDILTLNKKILSNLKGEIKGELEKNVTIKGEVHIGKFTVVRSGTYIEGPAYIGNNCTIGPNAYIRPNTTIGNNCNVRAEVVNSVIMDGTKAKHVSYIGHSVVGENCNIAAGTVTADFRHDGKNHTTIIKGKKIDTGLRKLGAFIGDNVRTGINTTIYPGRKIWPNLETLPGEVVQKDKMR
ncbi:MAG: NTP transferase domain-containing protein [Candidatus Aenigmarchaeota archaeon]|nr:NTP transferase domain-containing protein [Candidatus Aenigmarchaeota archaeon]